MPICRPFLKMKGLSSAAKRRVREGSTGSGTSFTTSHENVRQSRAYHDDDDIDVDSLGNIYCICFHQPFIIQGLFSEFY